MCVCVSPPFSPPPGMLRVSCVGAPNIVVLHLYCKVFQKSVPPLTCHELSKKSVLLVPQFGTNVSQKMDTFVPNLCSTFSHYEVSQKSVISFQKRVLPTFVSNLLRGVPEKCLTFVPNLLQGVPEKSSTFVFNVLKGVPRKKCLTLMSNLLKGVPRSYLSVQICYKVSQTIVLPLSFEINETILY